MRQPQTSEDSLGPQAGSGLVLYVMLLILLALLIGLPNDVQVILSHISA